MSFFLQGYAPTVFENYTASFEIDTQRVELRLWDTSGKIISICNVIKHTVHVWLQVVAAFFSITKYVSKEGKTQEGCL